MENTLYIEKFAQLDNGKYCFVGHATREQIEENEKYCVLTKIKHYKDNDKFYKTYKYPYGKVETIRYDVYL